MSKYNIRVLVARPTTLHGERIEPGSTLKLPELDAAALIRNGKATLHDEGDEAALQAAVAAADYRAARSAPGYIPPVSRGLT